MQGQPYTRRRFLKLAALSVGSVSLPGVVGACAATSPSASPRASLSSASSLAPATVKAQIGTQNVEYAGVFAAETQGYFKAAAITDQLLAYGPNVQPVTVVAGGGALVGIVGGADTFIKAYASGIPVQAIGVMDQKAPSGLLSLAKNPIHTMKDAVGKKIGLQSGARGPWATIVELNGLKASDFTIVPVEFDPTPLVQGQVDGFWSYAYNQPIALQAKGLDVVFMTAFDAGYKFYGDVIFAAEQAISSSADALARWLAATAQGWTYAFANPATVAKETVDRSPSLDLNVTQQTAQLKAEQEFMTSSDTTQHGLYWMDEAVWQAGIDILTSQKALQKPVTAAEIMTLSVLQRSGIH